MIKQSNRDKVKESASRNRPVQAEDCLSRIPWLISRHGSERKASLPRRLLRRCSPTHEAPPQISYHFYHLEQKKQK